ncbi:hypothetical protein L596_005367 [Steinernema carpocapsae]|uniref:Uncharacterized protein n=1 Tax=Steinernema carpocapsae TaxID=34508 RepID=A0A4U8V089_STECR|nr:hypothetical protein L596_005367 [Steinernema carpocapsae]
MFKAELNNFFMKELAEDGYFGLEICRTTSSVEQGDVALYVEKVFHRGLCAVSQCESLRYKLIGGLAVRRACYGVMRVIMESGAHGFPQP